MTEWWRGAVTYQVYPRSFQDSNGDGVGDLPGITARLGYLADLGVDAVWLSPFFKSPMKDMGYDVSDYCDVDPVFGTLADFDALLARAHALGLKVIIDQVLSHSSDLHPAFVTSRSDRVNPKADWYVWADPKPDGSPPNNWLSVFGGSAWAWDARRKQYYLHNFLTSQPDLNYHNPDVQDWALDNLRFWLDRGVDGFRFDTVNYFFHDPLLRNNPADHRNKLEAEGNPYGMQYHLHDKNQPENLHWMERIRVLLDEYGAASVGEMGESHHAIQMMGDYTAPGRLHQCYSFEFMGYEYTAGLFRDRIESFFKGAPKGWPMWALSNHDVVRHVSRWQKHGLTPDAVAKQTGALLLALEGSICLWEAEELGQTDTELALEELTDPQGITFWPERADRPRQHPHAHGLGRVAPWRLFDRHALVAGETRTGRAACRRADRRAGVGSGKLPGDAGLPAGRTGAADRADPVSGPCRAGSGLSARRRRGGDPLPVQPVTCGARGCGDRRRCGNGTLDGGSAGRRPVGTGAERRGIPARNREGHGQRLSHFNPGRGSKILRRRILDRERVRTRSNAPRPGEW